MLRVEGGGFPDVAPDEPPLNENNSKFVTVKLYHGGTFTRDPLLWYKGGEFDMFDFVIADELSVADLNQFSDRIGYCRPHKLFFSINGRSMDEGLRHLEENSDVKAMVEALDEHMKIVEVFRVAVHDYDPLRNCLGHCDEGCDEDADSSDPETVVDSDYADSDDDKIYDSYVDTEVEAGGWMLQTAQKHVELPIVNEMEVSSGTDCGSVSGLSSHGSDSDDYDENRKNRARKEFDVDSEQVNPEFCLGMLFADKAELVKALRNHSVAERRDFKLEKNDKIRVYARCYPPCRWELTARKLKDRNTFIINAYNGEQTCSKQWSTRLCNSSLVSDWYVNDFANNPDISVSHLMFRVQNEKKVKISKTQAWKARKKALEKVKGKVSDQFSRLHDYVEECLRANPSSTFVIKTEDDEVDRFQRIYVCWAGLKQGFMAGYRKLVGIDGCHLKGNCTGILLAAVAMDANNCTYPVAYALVEIENKETWLWFISILIEDLQIRNHPDWVIISDRQKARTCACKKWDLTGIPCSHAIRAILDNKEHVENYISHWYFKTAYLDAYVPMINPINGPEMWPRSSNIPLQPPYYTKQPGRPKKARKRALDSPVRKTTKSGAVRIARVKVGTKSYRCGKCKKPGHYKTTCPELRDAKIQSQDKSHQQHCHPVVGNGKKVMAGKMISKEKTNKKMLPRKLSYPTGEGTSAHILPNSHPKFTLLDECGDDNWPTEFEFPALTQEELKGIDEACESVKIGDNERPKGIGSTQLTPSLNQDVSSLSPTELATQDGEKSKDHGIHRSHKMAKNLLPQPPNKSSTKRKNPSQSNILLPELQSSTLKKGYIEKQTGTVINQQRPT